MQSTGHQDHAIIELEVNHVTLKCLDDSFKLRYV